MKIVANSHCDVKLVKIVPASHTYDVKSVTTFPASHCEIKPGKIVATSHCDVILPVSSDYPSHCVTSDFVKKQNS